jgi:replicative DNA helicase
MQAEKTTEKTAEAQGNSKNTSFSFDKSFQSKILQAMLLDRMWSSQFSEVLDVNYFQYAHLKLIASEYVTYHKKWKEFPSMELLLTMIKDKLKNDSDAILRNEIKSFLITVETKKDLGDLGFVKQKALEFCKKAALQAALLKSVDLVETENYDKITEVVRKAISAGNEHNEGLNLFNDIDVRYSETYRRTIPTGIPELDQRTVLNGGLGSGELGFVVANSGCGKSHVLVQFGASAIKNGQNVVHYTFELNERIMGIRYDSNLTDIPSLQCYDEREKIKEFYKEKEDSYGKLIIKYFPTGQASTNTLRIHLEKLQTKGFIPDLIIVDYSGIMRSSDRNDLLRLELKKVCEELRSLAEDNAVPLWTAVQSNKEGSNSDVIDLTNMAESYAQAHVADFVLGLSRQSAQKASGFGNIFIAKNRAGIDGIKYHVHLDTSRSKMKVLTDDEASNYKTDGQRDFRMSVLKKFNELQNKKSGGANNNEQEQ